MTRTTTIQVIWTPQAQKQLREIRTYIAMDKPGAAERLAARVVALTEALRLHPRLGRPGPTPGTRELIVGRTPYIIVYRIGGRKITIAAVWHGARLRDN